MYCTFKYQIYPNKEQRAAIDKTMEACRFVYNYYLNMVDNYWEKYHEVFSVDDCQKDLTVLRPTIPLLAETRRVPQDEVLKLLDRNYKLFFRTLNRNADLSVSADRNKCVLEWKEKKSKWAQHPYPLKYVNSYRTTSQYKKLVNTETQRIRIPGIGYVKASCNRKIEGKVLYMTVKKDALSYWVSVVCDSIAPEPLKKTGFSVQVNLRDKSLDEILAEYSDFDIAHLQELKEIAAKENNLLNHKKKGGRNYEKQKLIYLKADERIYNYRKNAMYHAANKLVREYDSIDIIERSDSDREKMSERKYSRSVENEFVQILRYEMVKHPRV